MQMPSANCKAQARCSEDSGGGGGRGGHRGSENHSPGRGRGHPWRGTAWAPLAEVKWLWQGPAGGAPAGARGVHQWGTLPWGHCQGQPQRHPVGSIQTLNYFLLKTQLGSE